MPFSVFCDVLLLAGLLPCIPALSRPSSMVLENNQYKNMAIAIHESVTEDNTLIDTLKDTMREASKYLLKATKNRAYFKEITILLPHTWSHDPSYGAVTSETVNMADVIISSTVWTKRSLPQTRSYRGCGKQGVHVLLPVEFLKNPQIAPYKNVPGKYFVHAFAQFRWGVFQEYGETGDVMFYFSLVTGHPEAIRCSTRIRGLVQKNDTNHTICYHAINSNTGLYTPDCIWFPYPSHQSAKASLMDHQWISTIESFCDDDPSNYNTLHNYEAPSKHNRLCSHRSTWDVIKNTDDFSNGKNPPITNTGLPAIQPNFKIVRAAARKKRALVVIDDRLKASDFTINTTISRFRHESDVHGITLVTRGDSDITTSANKSKMDLETVDKIIYIQRDCGRTPTSIASHGDTIHVDKVAVIPLNKGKCQTYRASNLHKPVGKMPGHTLLDRLRETILHGGGDSDNFAVIHRGDIKLTKGTSFTESVHFDFHDSQTVLFIFHYDVSLLDISITSPSHVTYDMESQECGVDELGKLVKYVFQNSERGEWKYTLKSMDTRDQSVSVTVYSTMTHLNQEPIIVRTLAETSEHNRMVLHADVTQGSQPVIGLNVTASIETPSGKMYSISLYDNGAGADNSKNDGVYSRYFTKAETPGLYHVAATIIGQKGYVFVKEETYVMAHNTQYEEDETQLQRVVTKRSVDGNIQRHVTMGSVHVPSPSRDQHVDTTPPFRVVDLKVVRHLGYRNTLVLTWTAPGDDLDHGKVHRYEVYIGQDITDVRAMLWYDKIQYNGPGHIAVKHHDAVADAMETETLLWTIPPAVKKFAFSVRGVDEAGNKAELSNVATFGFIG